MNSSPNRIKMNEMTASNIRRGMHGKIIWTRKSTNSPDNGKHRTLRFHRQGR